MKVVGEVWIVNFVDEYETWAFTSREDAYKFIKEELKEEKDFSELLSKLDEDYDFSDDDFGVEDFVGCRRIDLYGKELK